MIYCASALASELPRIAVYVTGGKTADENNMFAGQVTHALVNSGYFMTIERADAFIEQVEREHATQRSGAIDDSQISRLGQQAGAQFVCIVQIVEAFGGHQISARIVNVENVVITHSGIALGELRSIDDFRWLSQEVVATLFETSGGNQHVQQMQQQTAPSTTSVLTHAHTQTLPAQMPIVSTPQMSSPSHFNPRIAYGTFTDQRDGNTYRTVRIGNRTWMAEKLNYRNPSWAFNDITSKVHRYSMGSWCYNNEPSNCTTYGRLYTWYAAREACPVGWRLPSLDDWETLSNAADRRSSMLRSNAEWRFPTGTNELGFSALPGGYYWSGRFGSVGEGGYWWLSTEYGTRNAVSGHMNSTYDTVSRFRNSKRVGYSVKCVRD